MHVNIFRLENPFSSIMLDSSDSLQAGEALEALCLSIASLVGGQYRTRFAPAPTGHLHTGHLLHLMYLWCVAGVLNATIVMRMEDHDLRRSKMEYARSIMTDLEWLGFLNGSVRLEYERPGSSMAVPAGVPEGDDFGSGIPYFQSNRNGLYEGALATLQASQVVYRCCCSRNQLLRRAGRHPVGEEIPYDSFCKVQSCSDSVESSLRLEMPDIPVKFNDLHNGAHSQNPHLQCGDMVLQDRHGNWSYQFAVVVDDMDQKINLVIRGEDLLASTGRQLALAYMLGQSNIPLYLHHPIVKDRAGKKLGKREGATPVARWRESGKSAASLLGDVAFQGCLVRNERELTVDELIAMVGEVISRI